MSESKTTAVAVRHNAAEHRFEAEADGHLSVAEYERRGDGIIFTHTFVPAALRGRGMAEALVRSGLAYACDERLRVVPVCSYVAAFIRRHPEYQPLLGVPPG